MTTLNTELGRNVHDWFEQPGTSWLWHITLFRFSWTPSSLRPTIALSTLAATTVSTMGSVGLSAEVGKMPTLSTLFETDNRSSLYIPFPRAPF